MTIDMITRGSRLFLLFLFLVSADCSSSNISDSILLLFNTTSITARLTPSQELYEPPPMSPAPNLTIVEGENTTGAAALTFAHVESNISTIVVEIAQNGLTQITNVGIHQAPPDANGPQVINVTSAVSGLDTSGFMITRGQRVSSIIADGIFATPQDYYIQVSTRAFPLGAIRGVLMDNSLANGVGLSPNQTVSAACLPSNVISPNPNKQQTATCTLFLTNIVNDTATMYFLIKTTLYMSDASGAALYKGVANTSGDLLVDLRSRIRFDSLNVNNAFRGLFQIPSSHATHLLSNPEMYYFEIDTLNHTQGATRGQFAMPPNPPPPPSVAHAPMPTSFLPPPNSPNFPPAPLESLGPSAAPSPHTPPSPPSPPSPSIPLTSSSSCRNEANSTCVGTVVGLLLINFILLFYFRRPHHAQENKQLVLDFVS